jgi:hypothetical protein
MDEGALQNLSPNDQHKLWLRNFLNGASSTETPTPADYGQKSGAVRRAAGVAAMTVEQRAMYRRGYQAHAQAVSRWRRRVLQALRSQLL